MASKRFNYPEEGVFSRLVSTIKSKLALVAFTGSYNDLSGKPKSVVTSVNDEFGDVEVTPDSIGAMKVPQPVPMDADLNNYIEPGFYYCQGSRNVSNTPFENKNTTFGLEVIATSAVRRRQLFYNYTEKNYFQRDARVDTDEWTEWLEIGSAKSVTLKNYLQGTGTEDGDGNISISVTPIYGSIYFYSATETENHWFKAAEATWSLSYIDFAAVFRIEKCYASTISQHGRLKIRLRTSNTAIESSAIIWEEASAEIDVSNYKLAWYLEEGFVHVALFIYVPANYNGVQYKLETTLNTGGEYNNIWHIYSYQSTTGLPDIPSKYTGVATSVAGDQQVGGLVAKNSLRTNGHLYITAWPNYGTGAAAMWYDGNSKTLAMSNTQPARLISIESVSGEISGFKLVARDSSTAAIVNNIGFVIGADKNWGLYDWSRSKYLLYEDASSGHTYIQPKSRQLYLKSDVEDDSTFLRVNNGVKEIDFGVGSSKKRGIYDNTAGEWIMYLDGTETSGTVYTSPKNGVFRLLSGNTEKAEIRAKCNTGEIGLDVNGAIKGIYDHSSNNWILVKTEEGWLRLNAGSDSVPIAITSRIQTSYTSASWIASGQQKTIISSTAASSAYAGLFSKKTANGVMILYGYSSDHGIGVAYMKNTTIAAGTNNPDSETILMDENGDMRLLNGGVYAEYFSTPSRLTAYYGWMSHIANAGAGNNGYIKIARITTHSVYTNAPIEFTITQRGLGPVRLCLVFNNAAAISSVYVAGFTYIIHSTTTTEYFKANIIKVSDGVFDLYLKKMEAHDSIYIRLNSAYSKNAVEISWKNEFVSSLPSTGTAAQPAGLCTRKIGSAGDSIKLCSTNGVICRNDADSAYVAISASAFTVSSSRRYKENIEPMSKEEAEKIFDVEPVTFDYIDGEKGCRGVIAEDVYGKIPSVVMLDNEGNPDSVDYSKFVPYLIKMIQMQEKHIQDLEDRLRYLETERK